MKTVVSVIFIASLLVLIVPSAPQGHEDQVTHAPVAFAGSLALSTMGSQPKSLQETESTITLQHGTNGYSGCKDTYISYQYGRDTNYSWQNVLRVGYKQQNSALVHFDLSPIPPNATITQSTLQLYATGWSGSNITLGAYCVLRNADPNQATWDQATLTSYWDQPGCNDTSTDRRANPESSLTTSGIHKWYDFDLTALTQEWVNSTLTNNRVLLRALLANNTLYFASAQNSSVSLRPKLVITYRTAGGSTATSTHTPTPTPTTTTSSTPTYTPVGGLTSSPTCTPSLSPCPASDYCASLSLSTADSRLAAALRCPQLLPAVRNGSRPHHGLDAEIHCSCLPQRPHPQHL